MPPLNDNFANATVVNGSPGTTTGSNFGASAEAGEPANNGKTVWWKWVCPATGNYFFSTEGNVGATFTDFKSRLQIFTASNPANPFGHLGEVPYVHNQTNGIGNGYELGARAGFAAVQDIAYFIRVDSRDGNVGNIVLHWDSFYFPRLGGCRGQIDFAASTCLGTATIIPSAPQAPLSFPFTTDQIFYEFFSFGFIPEAPGLFFVQYAGGATGFTQWPSTESCVPLFYTIPRIDVFVGAIQVGLFEQPAPKNLAGLKKLQDDYSCTATAGFICHGAEIKCRLPQQVFIGPPVGCTSDYPVVYSPPFAPFAHDGLPIYQDLGADKNSTYQLFYIEMFPHLVFQMACPVFGDVAHTFQYVHVQALTNTAPVTWDNVTVRLVSGVPGIRATGGNAGVWSIPPGTGLMIGSDLYGYDAPVAFPYTLEFEVRIDGILAGTLSYEIVPLIAATLQSAAPISSTIEEYSVVFKNLGTGYSEHLKWDVEVVSGSGVLLGLRTVAPTEASLLDISAAFGAQGDSFISGLGFGCHCGSFGGCNGSLKFRSNRLDGNTPVVLKLTLHDDTQYYPPLLIHVTL